jgi:hypothetical protein
MLSQDVLSLVIMSVVRAAPVSACAWICVPIAYDATAPAHRRPEFVGGEGAHAHTTAGECCMEQALGGVPRGPAGGTAAELYVAPPGLTLHGKAGHLGDDGDVAKGNHPKEVLRVLETAGWGTEESRPGQRCIINRVESPPGIRRHAVEEQVRPMVDKIFVAAAEACLCVHDHGSAR